MNWIEIVNYCVPVSGFVLAVLCSVALVAFRRLEKYTARQFWLILICLYLYITANFIGYSIQGLAGAHIGNLYRVFIFVEFSCGYLLVLLVTSYLLHCLDSEKKWMRLRYAMQLIFLLAVGMLIYSQFTGLYYTVSAQNIYLRSQSYWLSSVPSETMIVLDTALMLRYRNRLSRRLKIAFSFYLFLPLVGLLAQILIPGLSLTLLISILSVSCMFVYVLSEQEERYIQQERRSDEMRTAIMLSQIQPHFLYNSLGVIRELCHSDPARAEDATVKFSQYLRQNMDSLSINAPILFSQELEHTRNYLELERLRFGQGLRVEYDLAAGDFRLPVLTLQPIVENAVHHGARKNEDGGTVVIRTREDEQAYRVTVEDDGPGFAPGEVPADGQRHVGLRNVSRRLETMVNGRLEIDSAPGHGTRITIVVPKEGIHHADLRH